MEKVGDDLQSGKNAEDSDATYTSKRGAKHHGYKMHIATDRAGVIKIVKKTDLENSKTLNFQNRAAKAALF
ncbi:MAG: hypothetical protein IE887_04530 [Campylobacterales bacterium]|nr:hypothetical protein [Campylobacterales bacterium]